MAVQSLAAEQPARPSIPEVLSACASVGKVDDYVGSVLASHGLDEQFREFLARHGTEAKAEFYLPAAVSTMIALGQAKVRVLPTEASWFGVTYREDKPRVVAALAELVSRGVYPAKLFG